MSLNAAVMDTLPPAGSPPASPPSASSVAGLSRLRDFVTAFTRLITREPGESVLLSEGAALLRRLIARDDWLPEAYAVPSSVRYQQYLLHCDPLERFSVVSFVWAPGQSTPIHDHRVWGLIGVLRGAEVETRFRRAPGGRLVADSQETLEPGRVGMVSPAGNDLHQVANRFEDRSSISIHVYGGNIGAVRRATYDGLTGVEKPFISGYVNQSVPNLWDRSSQTA